MKAFHKTFLVALLFMLVFSGHLRAQGAEPEKVSPDSIQLKTLKGNMVYYGQLVKKNPAILICFWSVNSEESVSELNAINAGYEKIKEQAAVTVMAICVDQGSLVNRMRPMANQNGWSIDVYADVSGGLQQLLGYANVPQAMVLNKGLVVYQQSGYATGSESYLLSKLLAQAPPKK